MKTGSNALPLPQEKRLMVHRVFTAWLLNADADELDGYDAVRNAIAPEQHCSVVKVTLACAEDENLRALLPRTLRERLQEANLLPS